MQSSFCLTITTQSIPIKRQTCFIFQSTNQIYLFSHKRRTQMVNQLFVQTPMITSNNLRITFNPWVLTTISANPNHFSQVTEVKPKWYPAFIPNQFSLVATVFKTNPNTNTISPKLEPRSMQFKTSTKFKTPHKPKPRSFAKPVAKPI